ncbi:MAG: tyrosine-type recombinase/integrase [Saprospiraceae bacterium]
MTNNFFKYLEFEKRYSLHTIRAYKDDLAQFLTFITSHFELKSIANADHRQVRSWIVHMMQNDYTARSINRKISVLKSYFKYLKKKELVDKNPMSKIISPKSKKRLPEFIREKHMSQLDIYMSVDDTFSGRRDALIIGFLYQLGLRRAELIHLKDTDVNNARMTIKVLGKGNKERIIPMSSSILKEVDAYISLRKADYPEHQGCLFITDRGKCLYPKFVYNLTKKYLGTVSPNEYLGPHVLRHSFATHLANNGADLNAIKELMGHSSLAATQVYMHNTIDKLKEVYLKSHPRGKSE